MAFLHFVSDTFEYEEKNDDSSNQMSPDIDSLVVNMEKRFDNAFWIVIVKSISLQDMLIVLENFRGLIEMAYVFFTFSLRNLLLLGEWVRSVGGYFLFLPME